ncbi:acyl carrier protein [Kitasatospora mediocidica]|uniref:acyl carrier protein n=1 Tax=Kitasatospora mediocidica TaxID=58352 RepID=UPI00068DEEB2|nr:acyl carrier protein [Kitasatospora mediocidica]
MPETTPIIELLRSLPWSERRDALEGVVVTEFKNILLMDEDEYLSTDESYFQLGFTSLRIVEVKQRLESLLGFGVSTNVLFNSPTIEKLMDYLTGEVLVDLFDAVPVAAAAGVAAAGTETALA